MADLTFLAWDCLKDAVVGKPGPMSARFDESGRIGFSCEPIPTGAPSNPTLLAKALRSYEMLPDEIRLWLADLFDPNSDAEFKAEIRKRHRGAPKGRGANPLDIMNFYNDQIERNLNRKSAIELAMVEFGVRKTTITNALREAKEINNSKDY